MAVDKPAPLSRDTVHRIVFTGGPGGGKSTAADLLQREFPERLVIVPETATLLHIGGFPRWSEPGAMKARQKAIFNVQKSLEELQMVHYPGRVLICDRGTIDGGAYWPDGPEAFYREQGTTLETELARYTAVLFFESAAVGGLSIENSNQARTENLEQAIALDTRVRSLWAKHPRFHLIPHEASFFQKMERALSIMRGLLG